MTASRDFDIGTMLEDTNLRLADRYVVAFREYLVAVVLKDATQTRAARLRLEEVVKESMGRAEVLGAVSVLRGAASVLADEVPIGFTAERGNLLRFAASPAEKILHRVTFEEALEDMVSRVPFTLRTSAERTAAKIAEIYSNNRGLIVFAKSAEDAVTRRAQDLISSAIREGIPEREIGRSIAFNVDRVRTETAAWTEGYARMAFRTNLGASMAAGKLRQARDPDVKKVIPAMRFSTAGDVDTRPNHQAADGVILSVDNPAWRWLRSPLGYNCRCRVDFMSLPDLRRMGRLDAAGNVIESKIPHNARPDAGFRPGGSA